MSNFTEGEHLLSGDVNADNATPEYAAAFGTLVTESGGDLSSHPIFDAQRTEAAAWTALRAAYPDDGPAIDRMAAHPFQYSAAQVAQWLADGKP